MKFGISSLMILVFVASVICGIAIEGSLLAFGIGFLALAVLIIQLMSKAGPRPVVVQESANEAEAYMLRNYLAEHGVAARVEDGQGGQPYSALFRPRVVVAPQDAERTQEILRELATRSSEEPAVEDASAAIGPAKLP